MLQVHHLCCLTQPLLVASFAVCLALITFANTLDPDQNGGPNLDPNCLHSDSACIKIFRNS